MLIAVVNVIPKFLQLQDKNAKFDLLVLMLKITN